MAWGSALAVAGSAIVGDLMTQQGQQQTNAMSTANMLQQEQWQTNMSNTAMQRRVADLRAAGLNPMLATGSGGAVVGGVGTPSLQNPNQAFGNLGMQSSATVQAMNTAAQTKLTNAQADLVRSQTPGDVVALDDNGEPDWNRANGGVLGNLNAAQASQNIKNAKATWETLQNDIKSGGNQVTESDARAKLAQLNLGTQKQIQGALVQQAINESKLSADDLAKADAQAQFAKDHPALAKWLNVATQVIGALPGIHSGVSAFNKLQYPTTGH